jgi:hypothetical protein
MLEQYFSKPATIDRLHGSWVAVEIEAYLLSTAVQDDDVGAGLRH